MFAARSLRKLAKASFSYLDSAGLDSAEDADGDVFHECEEAALHPDASPDGGLACNDTQLLSRQRSAIMQIVKQLGKNLLTGNLDLLKVSLPVLMCEPRSYLQKLADPWVYPRFLHAAAETHDPVERLQLVVTYIVAGLHRAFLKFEKPFNPILGETFEASLPDGSNIFLEQISHHPPISAFELAGPGNLYTFRGLSQPSVSYKTSGGLSIKTVAHGYRSFTFQDGTNIEIRYPSYYIKGLLLNCAPRAEVSGQAVFVDRKHGLTARVTFGPVEGSRNTVLQRGDAFSGAILRDVHLPRSASSPGGLEHAGSVDTISKRGSSSFSLGRMSLRTKSKQSIHAVSSVMEMGASDCVTVASCTGNWLSHLDWDGQRMWTLVEEACEGWQPRPDALPSDSRFREDLTALAAGDVQLAQRAKDMLEQRQRADAKLRKEGLAS